MLEPSAVTWILVIFGAIQCLPLFGAQILMLFRPRGQKARDLLVGAGEDWRDDTHFRSARGMAWADWILVFPLLVTGSIGVLLGTAWGYLVWGASGAIVLYINVTLFVLEKEYVYPSRGPLAYYTYYWGFFVLWGALALVYSILRLARLVTW